MRQTDKDRPKATNTDKKQPTAESKLKKPAAAEHVEVHVDEFPIALTKIELLNNLTLRQQANALAERLRQKEQKVTVQQTHRLSVSETVKLHLDDLEMFVYLLKLRFEEEVQRGTTLQDLFRRYRRKAQPFLQPLEFFQLVRELLPDAGKLDRHIDCLYFLCRSSLFRGVSMARFAKVLKLTQDINVLSLKIRLTVNSLRRPSLKLALLSTFQRSDLEGQKSLPYSNVRRVLNEQGINLTTQEQQFLVQKKLLFYRHSDEYIFYRELLEVAFQENTGFREFVLGVFAQIVVRAIRKKRQGSKKISARGASSGMQTGKTLKSLKQTVKLEDFVKKASTKNKSLALQNNIARSILNEIINAVPILVGQKIEEDLNVIKDVLIPDKLSEHEHLDLFPRLFASADYGRGLLLDKDLNLIQYDLPTGTELPRVSLKSTCPVPRIEILDVLVSATDCLFLLSEDWHIWVWELTGNTYRTRINLRCGKQPFELSRYYKSDRLGGLLPRFLSESERYVLVNHSFCDSCVTLIDKALLVVARTIRLGKRQIGMTPELLQRGVEFYTFMEEAKIRGKRIFPTSLISREELSALLIKEFTSDMTVLVEYLTPERSILNEDLENYMEILLKKHHTIEYHMEEKVHKLVMLLRNYYEKNHQLPAFTFDMEGVRRMLLTVDRRVTPNEASSFWSYLTSQSVKSFAEIKEHVKALEMQQITSQSFSQSLLLIFEKCIQCGIAVREQIAKLDHERTCTVKKVDFYEMLLRVQIGLTPSQVNLLLDTLNYTSEGSIDLSELLSHPQIINAESRSRPPVYQQEKLQTNDDKDIGLLPEVCLEDVTYIESLEMLVYTVVYPRQSTIFMSTICRSPMMRRDSTFLVAILKHYPMSIPPLIKYEQTSGFLLSAGKAQEQPSDLCLWDIRFKDVLNLTEPIKLAPSKILRNAHKSGVVVIQYLPHTQVVVTSCLDGSVKLWDPVSQGCRSKKQKVRLAAGYYSYLNEQMAQTSFVEVKRLLFKEVCYNLVPVTLKYQLPESTTNQKTELCLMSFNVPKTHYQKSSTNLFCVYSMSRLKIEIKESRWQDQLPRKLSDMLEEMARTRCRRIVNFRVSTRPVLRIVTPLEQLYLELIELNQINIPLRSFLDRVKELLEKRGRSKLPIYVPSEASKDISTTIEQQLGSLVNCRAVLRKLLPDRSRQRRLVLLNLHSVAMPQEVGFAQLSQCFSSAAVTFKQQVLEQLFEYYCTVVGEKKTLKIDFIVQGLFSEKQLLGWQRFLYSLAQAKSVLLYRAKLRYIEDTRLFLTAVRDEATLTDRRLQLLDHYLSSVEYSKVRVLFDRLPMEYEVVVPGFHRQMALELTQLLETPKQKNLPSALSKEFSRFLEICGFDDEPQEQTARHLAKELLPTQAHQGMTISRLASYLKQQKPELLTKLHRLCDNCEVELQLPLLINYISFNTDLNRGSLLALAFEDNSNFDYRDLFGEGIFIEHSNNMSFNLIISRMVSSLKLQRKPVALDKICEGYREGPKLHFNNFLKWLESIECSLLEKDAQEFFSGYLKGNSLGFAAVAGLQHAIELGYARLSCQYSPQVWNQVFEYNGLQAVKDFKSSISHIRQQLSKAGRKPIVVAGREFLQASSRLYRAKKADVLTRMACIGSLSDVEVAAALMRDPTYKVEEGSVHMEHLEQALHLFKPRQSAAEHPRITLLPDVVLRRLPKSTHTISVDDLPEFLVYNDRHIPLRQVREIQQFFRKRCGEEVPIEFLLPESTQLDIECCRNVGFNIITNGDSLDDLFTLADTDRLGIINQEHCSKALEHVCSAFESRIITRLIDFNRQQVTLGVFRQRMEQLVIKPVMAQLKRAFIYKLLTANKLHLLQHLSQFDVNHTGKVGYDALEKLVSRKGRRLHATLLYNWNSERYVGTAEAKITELEHQQLSKGIQRDIIGWSPEMQRYQDCLRTLLTRRLVELDITLYQLYYVNVKTSGGMLTARSWQQILARVQPIATEFVWYFLDKEVSYLKLCEHMKAVMPEFAPNSDSLAIFAELVHKKSSYFEVFRFMDRDKTGTVSLTEFISHCTNMRIGLPLDTVKEIFLQLSHSQKEFNYHQFVETLQPLASPSDRNDWIFSYKRAVQNELITVTEDILRNQQKFYSLLNSVDCHRFLNVSHGKSIKEVEGILNTINVTEMLLKRFQAALLANNKRKDVTDRKLFDKLVANYLGSLSPTKQECSLLWEAYLKARTHTKKSTDQLIRSPQTVQVQLNIGKILKTLKEGPTIDAMDKLQLNRFSRVTKENLKELLNTLGIVMSGKEVELALSSLNKSTYKELLAESMPTSHFDFSDESSSVLLGQIKQTVRQLCQRLNIDLQTLFRSFAKKLGDTNISEKYWIPLLVFTLGLKLEHAHSLYYYMDDDRNGQVSEEEWCKKFATEGRSLSGIPQSTLLRMLDIHRNGYLRPFELQKLIEQNSLAVTTDDVLVAKDVGLVNLSQWVRLSDLAKNSPPEQLTLKGIADESKLIERLIEQSTSVYALEEGIVAETISASTDGITLKGLVKAFRQCGIHFSDQDKSYFSSYFAVQFNPGFLNLQPIIDFLRRFSKRVVHQEDYTAFNELVKVLEVRKSNPREMFQKAANSMRQITKPLLVDYLRKLGLAKLEQAICSLLLELTLQTSEEEFMVKFHQHFRKAREQTVRSIINNIDRAPMGLHTIVSNVFSKLNQRYSSCDSFWHALKLQSDTLTKDHLQRLLIQIGLWTFSEQQIDEFFQFLDSNRSTEVSYFEFAAFWIACEMTVRSITHHTQKATKIEQLKEQTAEIFCEYIGSRAMRPVKQFSDCDTGRKGYLTLLEFKVFLKNFRMKLNDSLKISELMALLDPTSSRDMLGFLPLMARIAKYCDVFNTSAKIVQSTCIFDRQLAQLLRKLPVHEIKQFDGDYDSVLEVPELLRFIVARLGRKCGNSALRLTQFLNDFAGLRIEDIIRFGHLYHERLQDIELTPLPTSVNLPDSLSLIKHHFSRTNRIQGYSGRIHQAYRYLNVSAQGTAGISMLAQLMQLVWLERALQDCQVDATDLLKFLSTIALNRFAEGLFRIPIGDELFQLHAAKNTSVEVPQLAKSLVFSSIDRVNPFLQLARIKDSEQMLLQPCRQAYGVLCMDSHTIDYHLKLSRDLYELPICSSILSNTVQIIIINNSQLFEDTVKKLGGLLFNPCFKDNFGEVAKGWAVEILRLLKKTHQSGLVGLLRPGNLTFGKESLGYRHMFMALKCNEDGLAKCGLDVLYSNTTQIDFPQFNGDITEPSIKAYFAKVIKNPFNAPELKYAKQLSTLTSAIDVYAFGVMLFVVLFGEQPMTAESGAIEPSLWSDRRIFNLPLSRIMTQQQLDELWRDATCTDIGQAISCRIDCSDTNKQCLRDLVNVIQMCLNYEWFRRPTVDNLLNTVFSRCQESYFKQLAEAQEFYSPELLLAPLRLSLERFVHMAAQQSSTDLFLFGQKIDILKTVELIRHSMDHPRLLGSIISDGYILELLFVVLGYANSEYQAVQKYPIEVVRAQLFEVLQAYLTVLRKLLQKVTQATAREFIEHVLTIFAMSYLREPLGLLSDGDAPTWIDNYADDLSLYERLTTKKQDSSFTWNEVWFSLISPIYKSLLSNKHIQEYLISAEREQHINEFQLQNKLDTLTKQQNLQVSKSLIYYEDLVGISECLQSLHQSAREDGQSNKSALKIVLGYVKSLVLSHDINKTRALLDSRIGQALRGFVAHRSTEIRQQVMALYRELSMGLLPARVTRRSAEEVHKSLGVLHHFMSTTDRMDRRKFQDFSNDYYGFRAEIVRQILRQVCRCFSLSVLSSALAHWNSDTLGLFSNLLHGGEELLALLNSPAVEAFQNFYTYWAKVKDQETLKHCKSIHDAILSVNNPKLFQLLKSNPVISRSLQKLSVPEFQEVTLFYLSNRYVLLMNHYNKHSATILNELEALALSRHDKFVKSAKLTRLEEFRKELTNYLDQAVRFVRDCPRDRMLACSQLLERLSTFLQRLISELGTFQQLSMNVELIVVRCLVFYQELLQEHWQFMFTPQLTSYLLEQLFRAYSYHGRIRESQTQLSIQDMHEVQLLQSPEAIVEYVLRHDLLRKFMQNRMSEASNSLMRCFVNALSGQLQGRLYGIGFVGSFCNLARWQYSLVLAYMQTKTENLHVLQSYVEQANFRVRVFDILVRQTSNRLQNELIKAGFIEFMVQVLLPNQQQFDMRFYRSTEEFLPYRYSIPLRNEALCMITSVFWHRPQQILQELVAQMLKHGTVRREADNLTTLKASDMRLLDSLWLFSHLLESQEPNLLLEADNYSVRQSIAKLIEESPELGKFYPALARL